MCASAAKSVALILALAEEDCRVSGSRPKEVLASMAAEVVVKRRVLVRVDLRCMVVVVCWMKGC